MILVTCCKKCTHLERVSYGPFDYGGRIPWVIYWCNKYDVMVSDETVINGDKLSCCNGSIFIEDGNKFFIDAESYEI